MSDPQSAPIRQVSAAIAGARGLARAALAEAEENATLAAAALSAARASLGTTGTTLSRVRDEQLADLDDVVTDQRDQLIRRIGATVARLPAAATVAWPQWTVDAEHRSPGSLRIGTLAAAPALPALVPLLDHGHLTIDGSIDLVAGLLLRAIGTAAPGQVKLSIHDPRDVGSALSTFAPLRAAGLIDTAGDRLTLLDRMIEHIRRINEQVLAGGYATLREYAFATGRRPEPWRIVVLLDGRDPDEPTQERLARIVRTGAACGVHLITCGPLDPSGTGRVENVTVRAGRAWSSAIGEFRADPAPPADLVIATARLVADLAAAGPFGMVREVAPEGTFGLSAPIGS